MTKSSEHFTNLHDFLKAKRGKVKYAKKTIPNNNWNNKIKKSRFDPLSVKELHGSCWVGDCLFRKRGSELIFLAKNKQPTNPNSNLPPEIIIIKSCLMEFSSSLQHEKEILSNLGSCNNIVHCYGDEITTIEYSGQQIYNVLLEYCSGSSLHDRMISFGLYGLPEFEVRRYTRDIVHGLYYTHCNGRYIHGDIKPRNILLLPKGDYLVAKIASFGLARKLTPNVVYDHEICGSGPYTSPEVARDGYLDWPADVWALGCLVLEMLMGKWSCENIDNKYILGCYDKELPEIPKEISSVGKDFIKKCLITSPYMRKPIWLLIKHPFVCL